jgi:tetratricopeptide (TPR) repeat protein
MSKDPTPRRRRSLAKRVKRGFSAVKNRIWPARPSAAATAREAKPLRRRSLGKRIKRGFLAVKNRIWPVRPSAAAATREATPLRRRSLGKKILHGMLAVKNRIPLASVPALAAGIAALVVARYAVSASELQLSAWYAGEAAKHAQAGDSETALLCYEWLIQKEGAKPELCYAQAMAYQAKGDRRRALSIFQTLAPADQQGGYPPAHLAAARLLFESGDGSEATKRAIEMHLQRAEDGPQVNEAVSLLGRFYAMTGRPEKAIDYLLRGAEREPALLLFVTRLARDLGRESLAHDTAEQARRKFRERTEAKLDDPDARCAWAAATVALGDFPGAIAILEEGIRLSADPRYRTVLAQVYAQWALDKPGDKDNPVALQEHLERLIRGLKADPNNSDLRRQLGVVIDRKGNEADDLRSTLLVLVAEGKTGATPYALLGYDAYRRGHLEEAGNYWEQAFKLDPSVAFLANNLAWTLSHADPPDLTRALDLVNRALVKHPNEPEFRGTRGFILAKLHRWSEALPDLKAEVAAFPGRANAHLSIAEVYDNLGLRDLAAVHRQAAEKAGSPPGR